MHKEAAYQTVLSELYGGGHVLLEGGMGCTDITTETFHAEIKAWGNWKCVIGQLMFYNWACPKPDLKAFFFNEPHVKYTLKKKQFIARFLASCNITATEVHIDDGGQELTLLDVLSQDSERIQLKRPLALGGGETMLSDEEKSELRAILLSDSDGFVVDLDVAAGWLGVRKGNLTRMLHANYKPGVDFTVEQTRNPNVQGKYGANRYQKVVATPDCFKRLCMRSRGKRVEAVCSYFIHP